MEMGNKGFHMNYHSTQNEKNLYSTQMRRPSLLFILPYFRDMNQAGLLTERIGVRIMSIVFAQSAFMQVLDTETRGESWRNFMAFGLID